MNGLRHCACCRQNLPLGEFSAKSIRYCKFCNARLKRIMLAYRRTGQVMASVRHLHRSWNYWRQTPALDAMYLDPIEEGKAA